MHKRKHIVFIKKEDTAQSFLALLIVMYIIRCELLGGDLAQTINYGWHKVLNGCDMTVEAQLTILFRKIHGRIK